MAGPRDAFRIHDETTKLTIFFHGLSLLSYCIATVNRIGMDRFIQPESGLHTFHLSWPGSGRDYGSAWFVVRGARRCVAFALGLLIPRARPAPLSFPGFLFRLGRFVAFWDYREVVYVWRFLLLWMVWLDWIGASWLGYGLC
jgi:hypothetical protein